jgi:hypothetical protein
VIWATSRTATGMAKASETALHRSTRGCTWGRVPSLRKRRSSDSEAHRYWVGLRPMAAKARRQAWISGSSLSAATAASRDPAVAANRSMAAPAAALPVVAGARPVVAGARPVVADALPVVAGA